MCKERKTDQSPLLYSLSFGFTLWTWVMNRAMRAIEKLVSLKFFFFFRMAGDF